LACHEIQPANAMQTCFVGVCLEEENMKKKIIDEKIKIETKLTSNALPVVAPLQQSLCIFICSFYNLFQWCSLTIIL